AARNEAIDPVPVKSREQQAVTALHRIRSAYVADRTARINTVRGILREFGHAIPLGARTFPARARAALDDERIPAELRGALAQALDEIATLQGKARDLTAQFERLADHMPAVQHLLSVPGIGPITATALVAFVGDVRRFPSGRHFASYIGLTPRESSSGFKRRLGHVSKRGNTYLRMLLTHGARSVLNAARRTKEPDSLQVWALATQLRRGHNVATIALANRLARIAWRVWRDERPYERRLTP
ncbi:MAG: IS110 family transposase, partial [Bacillota bacterium]|nr:IS110 family transposase [Bacillota bacterium]